MTDYRNTHAWHEALDLAPLLVRVAEQLPDDEATGIAAEVRRLAIDVPAAVAARLTTEQVDAGIVVLRVVAALEVIERVYPALDTAAARAAADQLYARTTTNISETLPAEPPAHDEEAEAETEEPTAGAVVAGEVPAETPAETPVLVTPADAPTTVPVQPAPAAPTSVPVTGDLGVHPDSAQ
jgi:hypothetical protein